MIEMGQTQTLHDSEGEALQTQLNDAQHEDDEIHGIPEWAQPIMKMITGSGWSDDSTTLVNYVASFVLSDVDCDLEALELLPESTKKICIAFFENCLRRGLTLEEQGIIATAILPSFMGSMGNIH